MMIKNLNSKIVPVVVYQDKLPKGLRGELSSGIVQDEKGLTAVKSKESITTKGMSVGQSYNRQSIGVLRAA